MEKLANAILKDFLVPIKGLIFTSCDKAMLNQPNI